MITLIFQEFVVGVPSVLVLRLAWVQIMVLLYCVCWVES